MESVLSSCLTSLKEHRPVQGGGPGMLKVLDNRTGKEYHIEIKDGGVVYAKEIIEKVSNGGGEHILFDPGYSNTAPTKFGISLANGEDGTLRFRGYPLEELVRHSTFVEVAHLLIYGNLPSKPEIAELETSSFSASVHKGVLDVIKSHPKDAYPMGMLAAAISSMSSFDPHSGDKEYYKQRDVQDKLVKSILGQIPILVAHIFLHSEGLLPLDPAPQLPYVENFLYMFRSPKFAKLARALDILLMVHMEHELSCSAAAARHLVSCDVDIYTMLAGAVATLGGVFHGGANAATAKMMHEIGTIENIPAYLEEVKKKNKKLFGFGNRTYKAYENRVKIIRQLAEDVFEVVGRRDPIIEVSDALAKAAMADEYFVKRRLYPNVDFYSGIVFTSLGFRDNFHPVLFAMARVAGYLAHWKECLTSSENKMLRPRQLYIGE